MIKAFLYFPHDPIPEEIKKSLESQGVISEGWDMLVLSANPDEFLVSRKEDREGKKVMVHNLKDEYRNQIAKCFPMISAWSVVQLKGKPYGAGMIFADTANEGVALTDDS